MRLPLLLLCILTQIASYNAGAQVPVMVGPKNIKIEKIMPAVVSTPQFVVQLTTDKRAEYLKWFEIEVEFAVAGVEIVDELTIKYVVSINGKLCPGEVTHVNIPKGRERFSVMYISPRNLDRITGGKQLNQGMIDNIWITISKQGQVLAEKAVAPRPIPNLPQFPGMLLPKSETPFQVLWWDRHENVKSGSR